MQLVKFVDMIGVPSSCYVCERICFAKKSHSCADDRLLRPGKQDDEVWNEFLKMTDGTDYTWENPWSPDLNPFSNFSSACKWVSSTGFAKSFNLKSGGVVAMCKYGEELYFFHRIRPITNNEVIVLAKLYNKCRNKLESIMESFGEFAKKVNKIKL